MHQQFTEARPPKLPMVVCPTPQCTQRSREVLTLGDTGATVPPCGGAAAVAAAVVAAAIVNSGGRLSGSVAGQSVRCG